MTNYDYIKNRYGIAHNEVIEYHGWGIGLKPSHAYAYQANEFEYCIVNPQGLELHTRYTDMRAAKRGIDAINLQGQVDCRVFD